MSERPQRLVFGEVAELYDVYRPGYPEEAFDALFAYAGDGDRSVLDVGAGTGKASPALAGWASSLTCIEPDPTMADICSKKLGGFTNATVVVTEFENFRSNSSHQLIVCAQAWHWLDPSERLRRCAQLLHAGGSLATVYNRVAGNPLQDDLNAAYGRHAPHLQVDAGSNAPAYKASFDVAEELGETELFGEIEAVNVSWNTTYTTLDYQALLTTHSPQRLLADATRRALLDDIANVIESNGGAIDITYETSVQMARRS